MSKENPRDHSRTTTSRRDKCLARFGAPPKNENWAWETRALLESSAMMSLSHNAQKALNRIKLEHLSHAGRHNGRLIVTHEDFRTYGVTRSLVADAIDELAFKGLIRVERGRAADGTPHPNLYRLTWVGDHEGGPPTNEWKGCTIERTLSWQKGKRAERAEFRAKKAGRKRKSSVPLRVIGQCQNA